MDAHQRLDDRIRRGLRFRFVIAPTMRQAKLFIEDSGYGPSEYYATTGVRGMHGYRLDEWEVWFLQGMWPCRTHEDVRHMEMAMQYARFLGADIRRWWT
ncbi:hypothetical protein ACFY3G_02720 [Streptomyces phaeochromogenes]|uniref:hypothetical protein n=1 Tax=Streptomyces phaeochromogenes TaxID=1923 RepID=UPI00368AD42A